MARHRTGEFSVRRGADIAHSIPGGRISATWFSTVAHAGTHLDAPRHMFPKGTSIDDYRAARFVCRGVAVDVPRGPAHELTVEELAAADPGIRPATPSCSRSASPTATPKTPTTTTRTSSLEAARYLADRDGILRGLDVTTPDMPSHRRPKPFRFPVHADLLGPDVLIVENLGPGLRNVVGRQFLFVMAPITIPAATPRRSSRWPSSRPMTDGPRR